MAKSLSAARQLAERVRFAGDALRTTEDRAPSHIQRLRDSFFQNELQISSSVTPSLAIGLARVFDRLGIPNEAVEAFVYPSPDIQAFSHSGSTSECLIRFSSALIDVLDDEEIEFVAGHELGHFLLGHGIADSENHSQSVEHFMQRRAQEISVDRVGLIACGSLDIAIRALMKTASGLTSKHLRFDVGSFVSQLRNISNAEAQSGLGDSHPSFLVRCRALLWFSINDFAEIGRKNFSGTRMKKLDERIEGDLEKFVDGPARRLIAEAKDNLAMWMAAYEIIQDGAFLEKEQNTMAEMFGNELIERLKNFLREIPAADVRDMVHERMTAAREELESFIPTSFDIEIERIQSQVSSRFSK